MASQPGLTAQGGPLDGQFYPLQENEMIMGREEDCSILINWDLKVSRYHARIFQQSGLYWLEDIGSYNGTYLTLPGSEVRKLNKGESVLLIDGALIQLGNNVQLRVSGLSTSYDEARQMLSARLQEMLTNLYAGMAYLPPEDRSSQLEWLRAFEARLRSAQNEEEMMRIASEGTQTLFGALYVEQPVDGNLPPLSEDVPDPEAAQQVQSILNFFISNIWKGFPKEEDDQSD